MVSPYRKGIRRVSTYYLAGLLATLVFHLVTGWKHPYLPPLSFTVILIMLIVGLLWAVLNLTDLFNRQVRPQCVGELTIHAIVLAVAAACMLYFFV